MNHGKWKVRDDEMAREGSRPPGSAAQMTAGAPYRMEWTSDVAELTSAGAC